MSVHEEITARLDGLGIAYELISHAPAHTMQDCAPVAERLGGVMPKNLFLRPRRQEEFYLCVARPDAPFKTSSVSKQAGASRLGFASEEELMRLMRTHAGSTSPLGLLFEEAKDVHLLMDEGLRDEPKLIFHPCDNHYSLSLSNEDFFLRLLPACGHAVTWVKMEE